MRVMVFVKSSPEAEAGAMPSPEILAEMTRFNEQLVKAGIMLAGEGLHPTSKGFKVAYDGPSKRTVTDGPFAEAKEIVGGFAIVETRTREEAMAIARQFMELHRIHVPDFECESEIRPLEEFLACG